MDEKRLEKNIEIVGMSLDDLEDVSTIERDSFSCPWSVGYFGEILSDREHAVALVAKGDGEVVGYGVAWMKAGTFHIGNLAVRCSFRRRGIGELLLHTLMEIGSVRGCRLAILEVRESNQAAISLYRKFGFSSIRLRKGYYDDTGENAVIMITDLKQDIGTATEYQVVHNVE